MEPYRSPKPPEAELASKPARRTPMVEALAGSVLTLVALAFCGTAVLGLFAFAAELIRR